MNAFEVLLSKRWIVKEQNKELYYEMKDKVGSVKKFFTEKLGYQIVVNPYLIKLEKIPAKAQIWMGIQDFSDKIQYIFLCMILMFLEDKEAGEQFVLSELTEYIQMNYRQEEIDWTLYQYRRHLVKVIKVCLTYGMLKVDDGSQEQFMADYEQEVLYENIGTSRYFMRSFTHDILTYESPQDFSRSEWIDMDEERGIVRRQRVYRKILTSLGMYKEGEEDEDYAYIKNYRNMIKGELEEFIECELDIHKTSVFLVIGENCNMGRSFPSSNTLSDIVLLCNAVINEQIREGKLDVRTDESIIVTEGQFREMIEACKAWYGDSFIKSYREKTTSEFYYLVKETMEEWGMIECLEREQSILIRAVIGKIIGKYPNGYGKDKQADEQ